MDENSSGLSSWVYKKLEGRNTLKWLVSHVFIYLGMVLLIMGYCIVGAFTFQYLENRALHQKQFTKDSSPCLEEMNNYTLNNRTALLKNLYNVTEKLLIHHVKKSLNEDKDFDSSKIDEWILKTRKLIEDYEDKLEDLRRETDNCRVEQEVGSDWDFKTSLLFATTVVTTIGYGNRTPKSWQGRLATLLYAMLGVPLMLFCMRTLGRSIGHLLDGMYKRAQEKWRSLRSADGQQGMAADYGAGAPPQDGRLPVPTIVATGETPGGGMAQLAPEPALAAADREGHHGRRRSMDDPSGLHLKVPLALVFAITTVYNAIGAALFAHYEQWSFLEGFYFTFITISTIGFGDLVPKILQDDTPNYGPTPAWLVETSYVFYVMVGLTVTQMSFELTKETINSHFYRIGRSFGVIDAPRDDQVALSRRHRHSSSPYGPRRSTWRQRASRLEGGASSPSMRSAAAELLSGQTSTEASSAESMPRPPRPRSARPRRPDHFGPDD